MHSFLGGTSKKLDCAPIIVGGVEDHVHLLCRFGRSITQADWVKELKRISNLWLKDQDDKYRDFEWQKGYADFSVSQSNLEQVKQYIANQEAHHRKNELPGRSSRIIEKTSAGMGRKIFLGLIQILAKIRHNPVGVERHLVRLPRVGQSANPGLWDITPLG